MQLLTIGKNQAGQRLDKFLKKALPGAGTGFLYKMLRRKNITLNGKKAEGKEILVQGDEVKCFFSEETYAALSGSGTSENTSEYRKAYRSLKDISVLYEDEDILLLNKPAGILTQKAKPEDLSLNEWLIGHLLATDAIKEADLATFHPSVCNRLDRNTSGIVLCGKTLSGSQALSRVIRDRSVKKYYQTVCKGKILQKSILEGYLYKDEQTNTVQVFPRQPEALKDASYIRTIYTPGAVTGEYTLLTVELVTGKTHQIRAHLATDSVRRFTVEAFSGLLAGCLDVESLGVAGGCDISRTLHGIINVGTYFVQSDDKHYFSRSLGDAGDTIGIAINVDHNTVTGDGIGTA